MKVELKLYKIYDADLMALSSHGIPVSYLMTTALRFFVRGQNVYFYVPECRAYNLAGRKRVQHLSFEVQDEASAAFLKKEVKLRQRSAFLKALVRGCFISPLVGQYLANTDRISQETQRLKDLDLGRYDNLMVLSLKEPGTGVKERIIKPASAAGKKRKPSRRKPARIKPSLEGNDMSRFGDVADLAIGFGTEQDNMEEAAGTEHQADIKINKEQDDENIQDQAFDIMNMFLGNT